MTRALDPKPPRGEEAERVVDVLVAEHVVDGVRLQHLLHDFSQRSAVRADRMRFRWGEGEFDGVLCVDAMEFVPPEEWPPVLERFRALNGLTARNARRAPTSAATTASSPAPATTRTAAPAPCSVRWIERGDWKAAAELEVRVDGADPLRDGRVEAVAPHLLPDRADRAGHQL